jgi:CubicO group peptidase (beta-lactamase class C family)
MHRASLWLGPPLTLALAASCATPPSAVPAHVWPRSTPEAQGIASSALVSVLEHVRDEDLHLHELLVVRHGTIVLDARVFPHDGARPHDIASCTKTLTALAVGMAIDAGAIDGLDAPVLSFFEGVAIENDDSEKRAMTIEDALTMRSGLACVSDPGEITLMQMLAAPSYVDFALGLPMESAPGTRWAYCSPASHVLSAVVERATGQAEDAWLRTRLFDRIGVGEVIWPHDPQGVAHGWGDARMHAEDLARIGLLLLHGGAWDGERLLDPAWVASATTNRVGTSGPAGGYGYQIWISGGGAFYANGRGGQYVLVVPALDLVVVALGSASPEEGARYGDIFASMLGPAVHADALPESPTDAQALDALVAALAIAPAAQAVPTMPAIADQISGSTYAVGEGPLGWQSFALGFEGDAASLVVTVEGASSTFAIALDGSPRITRGGRLGVEPRHTDLDLAARGRWTSATSFEVEIDTIDRIDAGTLTFTFEGDAVTVVLFERTYLRTPLTFTGSR